ncbi:hypothetical protein MNBD_GAMMA06-791 [hydrothermal vent metagenome]|uniref:Lipoprotein n=1 Tax=hydrothermal vent metagenome TaxID=652676 RepID=A0A3B0X6Q3_9ZZZZ
MKQLRTVSIRGCFLFGILLLSACSGSGTTTTQPAGQSTEQSTEQSTGQAVTHTLLNGIWETGCIVDANNAGTSFTISDVYLNGARTSEKFFYSDALCTKVEVSLIETANATYVLGDSVAVDASISGLSIATKIEFESENFSLSVPLFDLVAIKNGIVTELYTGDVSSPATDGSSLVKNPVQLKSFSSAIKHDNLADVVSVETSGAEGNYTFNVGVLSPETGCSQYADWWEIISESGELIYRRILLHSHINEQPFARTGGPVNISNEQIVIIRAHMNAHASNDSDGYGVKAYKGSINNGFVAFETEQNFAANLAIQTPVPVSCLF